MAGYSFDSSEVSDEVALIPKGTEVKAVVIESDTHPAGSPGCLRWVPLDLRCSHSDA